jgi:hypothetical protein
MKKLRWLAIFLAAAYSANEVSAKGVDGAFGSVLAGAADPIESGNAPLSIDEETAE